MMWFLLLLLHTAPIELVISEAGNKLILKNIGDNLCEGHVEVYHNGIWGYVGDAGWSMNTEKVICNSIHCGEPVANSTRNYVKILQNSTIWLNELNCIGNERALWDCDGPGWNASIYQKLTVKLLRCSRKITISLDGDCAGALQYSDGQTSGYFCNNGLGNQIGSLVCKSLRCGGVRSIPPPEWMLSETFRSANTKMKINCSAFQNRDPDNPWQCVTDRLYGDSAACDPVPVICNDYRRLQLKGSNSNVCSGQLEEEKDGMWKPFTDNVTFNVCKQMHCGATGNTEKINNSIHVNCSDIVKVVLMTSENKIDECYGIVNIKVNQSTKPVCGSSWKEEQAEFVCKEVNCGKLIGFTNESTNVKGVMDHVECNGTESSLWHCQAQHEADIKCSSRLKVVCSDSMKIKLVDGPGKCAGRLAIKFEGQWRRVSNTSWTDTLSGTVCQQLDCGQKGKSEKFTQGSGNFLTVDCAGKTIWDIYKCLKVNTRSLEGQAVGITCENHKVVFLEGPEACSGKVGIKHGSKTLWLSGSTETWDQMSADTVCQQMHCGTAVNYSAVPENGKVWELRKCSSKNESLFNCKEISKRPKHKNSTAYVNCSGTIVMNLEHGCWGKVRVYAEEVKGDMCADTWTEEKSRLLCANLGCGTALKAHHSLRDGDIHFNSLDAIHDQNAIMTQWNFVRTQANDDSCKQRPAYVICSGSVRPRFSISSEHCSGNIEVQYEDEWIPVCSDALTDINAQNTICQELKCGNAVKLLPYFGAAPAGNGRAISNLLCSPNNESAISACSVATSQSVCKYTGLQCADWKVMVPVDDASCTGTVLVHSGKGNSAISGTDWKEPEKERLCKDINCDGYISEDTPNELKTVVDSFWNKSFSCANNTPTNIWECENKNQPSNMNALFIKCKGEPNVSLSDGCSGKVMINGIHVCARDWDISTAHKVCQEKNCGIAVSDPESKSISLSDAYHVRCENYHSTLGKCRRIKGKCAEGAVSIYCTKNVKFRSTEQYKGFLEVNYRGTWEKVCQKGSLSQKMVSTLCEAFKHENHGKIQQSKIDTILECNEGVKDIKRCVKKHPCGALGQASNPCKGVPPTSAPSPTNRPLAPIIVGVALLLLVVILIVLFIRFCVRRARKSKLSSRMLSTADMEFESGEYEDVMNKENEMEDFSPGRFRSEDEFMTENDGHSVSSLPYDDIDEADGAQPLTSPGIAAPADRDANMHEDGVTYEVEDPQESYDDIDTIPETTLTKADVHDSPQTTHDTATPPGLAQGDEDYLEPDQDG